MEETTVDKSKIKLIFSKLSNNFILLLIISSTAQKIIISINPTIRSGVGENIVEPGACVIKKNKKAIQTKLTLLQLELGVAATWPRSF